MIDLIDRHRADVAELCRKHHVRTLEVFGSAADGTFDPMTSDLDFLVEYQPLGPGQAFASYFDLLDDLRTLFGRPVDLVVSRAIENPYFREAVNRSRQVVYAA